MTTYTRGHVTVDESFARFGSKSYAINKITSVDVRVHEKSSSGWLIFGIVAALVIIAGLGQIKTDVGAAVGTMVVGAALFIPAVLMYPKRISRTYTLLLATAAGEVQALAGANGEAMQELRDAIETRIAAKP